MESVDRAFCTTPLIGRRLLPASHKPFLQTSGLPVPSMPYTHVCDVVLLRLHLCNVYSSILKNSCCKWNLSKDRKDSMNAKSPIVMRTSTYRSISVLVLNSNMTVSGSLKSTFRRTVFQG